MSQHRGLRAHPLLREFVTRRRGHCYKSQHLAIADLLIPEEVRAFRDGVINNQKRVVADCIDNNTELVHAEFTAGRGIAQAIHHWKSIEVANLLIDAGADLHVKTTVHEGDTPLAMQLRFGTTERVQFLLDRGADPNRGVTTHIPSNRLEVSIRLLQQHGWEINGPSNNARRSTMLHHDAKHGFGSRIAIWLAHGADPNIQDQLGQTPLHILAARGNSPTAFQALLDAGADINAMDDAGRKPSDITAT